MNSTQRLASLVLVAGAALASRSASAQVVASAGPGTWGDEPKWQVVERLRIGSLDGPIETTFGGGQISIRATDDFILVLDHEARVIRVFDHNGRFVRSVGREGKGPGEFSAPMGILVDPGGRWWVPEAFAQRYTLFDVDGGFVRTVPRELRGYNRMRQLRFESDSTFIDHATADFGAGFFRADTLGAILETFPRIRFPDLPIGLGGPILSGQDSPVRAAIRFGLDRLVWTLAPDLTLWFGYSNEYRLVNRTLAGDTLRVVDASHRRASFTAAEAEIVRAAEREKGLGVLFSPQIWRGVHVLEDGYLVVQVNGEFGDTSSELDVFDPAGLFLGTLDLPFRMPHRSTPAFIGDRMILVAMDDFDVQYVVVLDIVRE